MQTQIFRRAVLGLMALGLTLGMLTILSCGGDDDDDAIELQANLRGANEVPLVPGVANSPGSGTAELTINDDQTQISYVLTYTGLSNVAQAHIHVGDANTAGDIIFFLCTNIGVGQNLGIGGAPLPTPPACPAGSGTVTGTLTQANLIPRAATAATPEVSNFAQAITQILNGNTYTNVHTNDGVAPPNTGPGDFPAGEIRGQNVQ
jgi:hypothetical protein